MPALTMPSLRYLPGARAGASLAATLAVLAAMLAAPATARADVTGKITVNGNTGKPPLRGKAFVKRSENPFVAPRPVDPAPYLVVVLERDGVALPPAKQVGWRLLGESFDRPLLAVVAGSEVVINNAGRRSPTLYVDGHPDLLPKSPFNPGGQRGFKPAASASAYAVLDADSPHLAGLVAVFATPYFATPTASGRDGAELTYTIAGVPDGSYTLRVWHKTGWFEGVSHAVEVKGGKASRDLALTAPFPMAAGAAGKGK
jgi:hypothetical protein